MKKSELMREVLRSCAGILLGYFLMTAVSLAVFSLYALDPEPFVYAFVLSSAAVLLTAAGKAVYTVSKAKKRRRIPELLAAGKGGELRGNSMAEKEYLKMLLDQQTQIERLRAENEDVRRDSEDYYTAWVHQIKTPIAVMRLELDAAGGPDPRALEAELFRIERYVDMALQYVRLGNDSADLVIRQYAVDELVREEIRKFAPQFVRRKLHLDYRPTDRVIVTDKKWFACILDQFLSNAIKYTPEGSITIREEDGILLVSDTGIGIAPEDLPRIFEKGYTGANGRLDRQSSGLGLYLAGKAARILNLPLKVSSRPGEGSTFGIDLNRPGT